MGLPASSVIPLLSKWEEYLSVHPDGDITGFARWVLATAPKPPAETGRSASAGHSVPTGNSVPPSCEIPVPAGLDATAQSALLISRIYRILQFLSKPVAKELGFTKPMEFSMLVQTAIMNRPNKKQLCQEMLIEGSTGVEITKRLAAKGFIQEQPDGRDRRSVVLSLTEKGRQTLLKGYTKLEAIHCGLLDGLQPEEKEQLARLLTRLNDQNTSQLPPLT
jgi:DNA-binding MarR family transcriptional regulator